MSDDLDSVFGLDPRQERQRNERHLAASAHLLYERGDHKTAALLLDVSGLSYRWVSNYEVWDDLRNGEYVSGWIGGLQCPPFLVTRFDRDELEATRWALSLAGRRDDMSRILEVELVPVMDDPEWRARLTSAMADGPTNQARGYPLDPKHPRADRMSFRSVAELHVYQALKRAQASRPSHRTIGIAALPMFNVPTATWEPDFVVTYGGKVGVIEVDGPHHRGTDKRAAERSKDRLLEYASPGVV